MPVSTVSNVQENSHIKSLRAKHIALSKEIEHAQKDLSSTDFYLSKLKKEKLLIKEKLSIEEKAATG